MDQNGSECFGLTLLLLLHVAVAVGARQPVFLQVLLDAHLRPPHPPLTLQLGLISSVHHREDFVLAAATGGRR